jgi:type I restriction enzyme M protein
VRPDRVAVLAIHLLDQRLAARSGAGTGGSVLTDNHKAIAGKIWEIANRLRGPYRPPQYRLVMLPMIVLRRLDCVLEPTKDTVLAEHARLVAAGTAAPAIARMLTKVVDADRQQPLYNTSPFTFAKLLGDSENIAPNLVSYINGFSPTAHRIFEKFKFSDQIEKLDSSNRLYAIVKAMADVDLHFDTVSNLEMGYIFEHLVMRFNEQANEEAGDHFTPREVIRLMTHLVYTGEEDVYKPGVYREIYDPACGTGGMLSVSEETIRAGNRLANLGLYGQEYNDESWAICCSDMLIKDEETDHIILGDTLGDGKTHDGFQAKKFHYMLANPPFGVEWKDQQKVVGREHEELGFDGRFGAGLPAINDGSFLFLQHMMSKMLAAPEEGGEGSKIAIIFNGSPLFSGDAGSGPSNIRRWIIENDWLDAIVALPDQLFYNTGIFTYVWLVTNRKAVERAGRVQLIDGTRFFMKMKKSLNNKRNEMSETHIARLTEIYDNFRDGETDTETIDGKLEKRVVSRIFENREFGFLKVTVERPLRLNIEATPERIARLDEQSAFANLAVSKKRKDAKAAKADETAGRVEQEAIRAMLETLERNGRWMDRDRFEVDLDTAANRAKLKLSAPIREAIFAALGERDPNAKICHDSKNRPRPDSELRDTENIPLPPSTALPLPMSFGQTCPTTLWSRRCGTRSTHISRRRCYRMCPMRGSTMPRPRSAMKYRSTGISMSTSHRAHWPRLRQTSISSKERSRAYSPGLWHEHVWNCIYMAASPFAF